MLLLLLMVSIELRKCIRYAGTRIRDYSRQWYRRNKSSETRFRRAKASFELLKVELPGWLA
jgi:hypothetical protein